MENLKTATKKEKGYLIEQPSKHFYNSPNSCQMANFKYCLFGICVCPLGILIILLSLSTGYLLLEHNKLKGEIEQILGVTYYLPV